MQPYRASPPSAHMSKYVLSNIFHYLPVKDALRIRTVARKFDEACLIGMKLCVIDMQDRIDQIVFVISTNFSKESIEEHKGLRETEMQINVMLRDLISKQQNKRR